VADEETEGDPNTPGTNRRSRPAWDIRVDPLVQCTIDQESGSINSFVPQ